MSTPTDPEADGIAERIYWALEHGRSSEARRELASDERDALQQRCEEAEQESARLRQWANALNDDPNPARLRQRCARLETALREIAEIRSWLPAEMTATAQGMQRIAKEALDSPPDPT